MQQLVVLSGKGGTGKTTVAAALAHLAARQNRLVLVDADVDAANLGLVISHRTREAHDFQGRETARIDRDLCMDCGICQDVCRFDAVVCEDVHRGDSLTREDVHPRPCEGVHRIDPLACEGAHRIDSLACEGCRACLYACPRDAIGMEASVAGQWFRSDTELGPLFHAHLFAGQENSGKLVAELRRRGAEVGRASDADLVVIDGPPGTACPVIAAATGCDLALLVAEPSLSGLHDLTRALSVVEQLGVMAVACVNKSDLSPRLTQAIGEACRARGVELVATIPFDPGVTRATVAGVPVTTLGRGAAREGLEALWDRLEEETRIWTPPAA